MEKFSELILSDRSRPLVRVFATHPSQQIRGMNGLSEDFEFKTLGLRLMEQIHRCRLPGKEQYLA